MKYELFPVADIAPGEMRRVRVNRLPVVIIRTPEGDLCALHDRCPHRGAKLSIGRLGSVTDGNCVGDYRMASSRYAIRCPWHQFEYDVATGRCVADPALRTRSYPVEVVNGTVVIDR